MGDLGGLLVGIAALGTLILTISTRRKHGRQLEGIDKAVNGKAPDEPYLRDYVVGISQAVGRVEGRFEQHAADDERRFEHIDAGITDLRDILRRLS